MRAIDVPPLRPSDCDPFHMIGAKVSPAVKGSLTRVIIGTHRCKRFLRGFAPPNCP